MEHTEQRIEQANEQTEKKSLFEELSVKELEERLELADCCICRIGDGE